MRIEDKMIIELCKKEVNYSTFHSIANQADFNIDYFFNIIDKHMITAVVLSKILKLKALSLFKKRIYVHAKKSVLETTFQNQLIKNELLRTQSILNKHNIESILIKGLSLDFSGLRKLGDLDILVHQKDLLDAIEALKEIDYYYVGNIMDVLLSSDEKKDIKLQLNWNNQFQLHNKETGILLELHTNLFQRDRAYRIKLDRLWDNIDIFWDNKIWSDSLNSYIFSNENLLILICMHNAIKRSLSSNRFVLRSLIDIENLIERGVDWNEIIETSTKCKIMPFIFFSLSQARYILDAEIEDSLLEDLKVNCSGSELFLEELHSRCFQSLEASSVFFSNVYKILSTFVYKSTLSNKI